MSASLPLLVLLLACDGKDRGAVDDTGPPPDGGTPDGGTPEGGTPVDEAQVACEAVTAAAAAYVASLDAKQAAAGVLDLELELRQRWTNVPAVVEPRDGLYFEDLSASQLDLVDTMITTSLSAQGAGQVADIVAVEQWWEDNGDTVLTPDLYSVVVFGDPLVGEGWAWQLDGHHLAINFTARCPALLMTPVLWGIQPREVPSGSIAGLRAMADEVDRGLEVLHGLDSTQFDLAVISDLAPGGLTAGAGGDGRFPAIPEGIPASELDDAQREQLIELIATWVDDLSEPHAALRMLEIEADLDATFFAWAGPTDGSDLFYYRIQGPSIYVELDVVGTDDHIHSVYRNPINDYGVDTLAAHYTEYDHGI